MSEEVKIKVDVSGGGYTAGFEITVDESLFQLQNVMELEAFVRGMGDSIGEYIRNKVNDG